MANYCMYPSFMQGEIFQIMQTGHLNYIIAK